MWLAGRKSSSGWAIGLAAQALWIGYAIATRQWGFIASAGVYGAVYGRNLVRWRREGVAQPVQGETIQLTAYLPTGRIDLEGPLEKVLAARSAFEAAAIQKPRCGTCRHPQILHVRTRDSQLECGVDGCECVPDVTSPEWAVPSLVIDASGEE
ncbi:hypothetical protein [Amycolatopsis thermophila]|uniref:Uncharacterized protein n=1 Tax=Amycolatopsis thermophila TaxID=206084 RepID=A0ABU0EML1_9PSEU|nr:hypothetical protein [Amycolatopsis thermophila]MDQ0376518.1 hypothetical protein [Amycolatopsis thermophila]